MAVIYQAWHGEAKVVVTRENPIEFLVTVATSAEEMDQALVVLYGEGSDRSLAVTSGYLTGQQIPAEAYTEMWRAITSGRGL